MEELLAACGGSEVFLVLVYEVHGLDWPVEWHWTSAQKAEGRRTATRFRFFTESMDMYVHRKTAPFGPVG